MVRLPPRARLLKPRKLDSLRYACHAVRFPSAQNFDGHPRAQGVYQILRTNDNGRLGVSSATHAQPPVHLKAALRHSQPRNSSAPQTGTRAARPCQRSY